MARKLSDAEFETFLAGLPNRKSQGERADAAHFIKTNRARLKQYVARKRGEGRDELAKYYEKVIEEHKDGPRGVYFSDSLYSIRSFRPSRDVSHSLTFPTDHRIARIVGWLLAAALAVSVLYAGYKVAEYGRHVFGGLGEARSQAIEEIRK